MIPRKFKFEHLVEENFQLFFRASEYYTLEVHFTIMHVTDYPFF